MTLIVFVTIPLLFPLKTLQEPANLTRNGARSTPGDSPSVSVELLRIFGSFFSLKHFRVLFRHIELLTTLEYAPSPSGNSFSCQLPKTSPNIPIVSVKMAK